MDKAKQKALDQISNFINLLERLKGKSVDLNYFFSTLHVFQSCWYGDMKTSQEKPTAIVTNSPPIESSKNHSFGELI